MLSPLSPLARALLPNLQRAAAISTSSLRGEPAAVDQSPRPDTDHDSKKSFYASDLVVERCSQEEMMPKPSSGEQLKFGHSYTDHMVDIDWDNVNGWNKPVLHKMREMRLHPGAKVLHYAIELFEGMKAYRGIDNKIRLFRPDMNMARMNRTAIRASLPSFDGDELIKIICEMIRVDHAWVPPSLTHSLYIRPTLIATDHTLGVGHPNQAKLFVLAGPVGSYFSSGWQPVSLLADSQFIRAFPGGVGGYKMGCNYAPTILVGKAAQDKGCQQVLWLHGEKEELTEVGTMNIFVFWRNDDNELELVTPPLNKGLILPGVTRDTLLELSKEYGGFKVSERSVCMEDISRAVKEKRMLQMFGSGTACVVCPVDRILHHNRKIDKYEELHIPTMHAKGDTNVMQRLYEQINNLQYGRIDRPGWTVVVE